MINFFGNKAQFEISIRQPLLRSNEVLGNDTRFITVAARLLSRDEAGVPQNEYEVTVEDPNVYTRPWTVKARFKRAHADGYEFLEDACHEGEQSADKMLIPANSPTNPKN